MISLCLALVGLILLTLRLWPRGAGPQPRDRAWPKVSLIIPARNEEAHLPRLLDSLEAIDYPNLEIIVVDDSSTDATLAIAQRYPVQVVSGRPRPEGWLGKPWACHQGSLQATGELLLFTDADTDHRPESLKIAVATLLDQKAAALSALPFHQNPKLWERLTGPFQLLLIALTNPYGTPKKGRVFAIGQYLLFHRSHYDAIGGHEAIRSENVDDLALAGRILDVGARWVVYTGRSLYSVHMYETLMEFIQGWRRNFRGGMRHNSPLSALEVGLFFMAMTKGLDGEPLSLAISGMTVVVLALTQNKIGSFSIAGILLLPFSIILFTGISLLAVYDKVLLRPLVWKNRSYAPSRG